MSDRQRRPAIRGAVIGGLVALVLVSVGIFAVALYLRISQEGERCKNEGRTLSVGVTISTQKGPGIEIECGDPIKAK